MKKYFRSFQIRLIAQIAIMVILTTLILWSLQNGYWINLGLWLFFLIFQVIFLIRFVGRSHQDLIFLLKSIKEDDFSKDFTMTPNSSSFKALYMAFQEVIAKFHEIRTQKEVQFHFLRSVVQHLNVGLMVIDQKGYITLTNSALARVLRVQVPTQVEGFGTSYQPLLEVVYTSTAIQKQTVRLITEDEWLELSVSVSVVKLLGEEFHIISVYDIQAELEDREMEAWQNLTRVLTHEIINSVTPISSIASTLLDQLNELNPTNNSSHDDPMQEVYQAVKVIEKRSEGLIRFVNDFRNFSKINEPQWQWFKVEELFKRVALLMHQPMQERKVRLHLLVNPPELFLTADQAQMEQILINLIQNSIQSFDESITHPLINLMALTDELGKVIIKVQDNGTGISPEAQKNIFIPFFTTKKSGSGIGLSLAKQIMRAHGGNIGVQSMPKQGTTFTLKFA